MVFESFAAALGQVFVLRTFTFLLAGVVYGGFVGILPGFGGAAAVALLLPFTFSLSPIDSFALLMGTVSVTSTTGDLTSILLGVPGEATAAATVVDGHAMARKGEGGRALGASLMSSLMGTFVGRSCWRSLCRRPLR